MKIQLPDNIRLLSKEERKKYRGDNQRCSIDYCKMWAKYINETTKELYCCDHFPFEIK